MRTKNQDTTFSRLLSRRLFPICSTAILAAMLAGLASTAQATLITFEFNTEFSGATPPVGASPWLTATFDDAGSPGSVKLKLTATNLTGSEFVGGAYFNLNTSYNPATALSFSTPTKTGTFNDPGINLGTNAYKADGDGKYDIRLDFASGPPSARFGVGDAVEYTITGIGAAAGTLVANDFKFLSAPDGGHGPFYVAAHVQGIGTGGNDSGWVTTPEPASWVLALGLVTMIGRRRR